MKELSLIRDQTRGELTGAATQMRSVRSKVEEVITNTAAGAAADQKRTQDMVEQMLHMVKEQKRKKPETDEGEDF